MPILTFNTENGSRYIHYTSGYSIREILDTCDTRVQTGCRGNGMCGLCLVKVEEGDVGKPAANEFVLLSQKQIESGLRLACQTIPNGNVTIEIINPEQKQRWRYLSRDDFCLPLHSRYIYQPVKHATASNGNLGAAVDLGTTNISISVWDMEKHVRLVGRTGINQQSQYGSDVISRLVYANESPEKVRALSNVAKNAIADALKDIASKEFVDLNMIRKVVVVGNTPMLSILTEKNYELLLDPAYWASYVDYRPDDTDELTSALNVAGDAHVEIIPPVSGFVGSDLLAGIIATEMMEYTEACLLVDFGTNTEIALWSGNELWVTSAAGGPAFEGTSVCCGMPAQSGAVFKAQPSHGGTGFDLKVMDGTEPKGICGSGLVDLVAVLLGMGVLNETGNFVSDYAEKGYLIDCETSRIIFGKRDVDGIQRAKAAVAAGVGFLTKRAGVKMEELSKVYVCGTFGRYLDIRNAQKIGLLPDIDSSLIKLCGNTALAGAELLLNCIDGEAILESLRHKIRFANMSDYVEFDDLFFENLYLRPMKRG